MPQGCGAGFLQEPSFGFGYSSFRPGVWFRRMLMGVFLGGRFAKLLVTNSWTFALNCKGT